MQYNEEATRELANMIGDPVTPATKAGFIKKLDEVLERGADPNVKLKGNGKVQDGETPAEYYRRRQQMYADIIEEERTITGSGESGLTQHWTIAGEIAEFLEAERGKKRAFTEGSAHIGVTARQGSAQYEAIPRNTGGNAVET